MSDYVYIVVAIKPNGASEDIQGVYSDKAKAQQSADLGEALMNDDNYRSLVVQKWELDESYGQVDD